MSETASCFLHGGFDATLRRCPECAKTRPASVATAQEDIRAGDLVDIDMPVGTAVQFTRYDPETRRSTCGSCSRTVATGQERCVCGAVFVATLCGFGDATAATIGKQELGRR